MPISLYKYLKPAKDLYAKRAYTKKEITPEQEFARYVATHPEEFAHLNERSFLALMESKFGESTTTDFNRY